MATSQHRSRGRRSASTRSAPPRWVLLLAAVATVATLALVAAGLFACTRPAATRVTITTADKPAAASTTPTRSAAASSAPAPAATTAPTPAPAPPPVTPQPGVAATVVPVLLYHHVSPDANNFIAMTPAAFERQIVYLRDNGYHAITQAQMNDFLAKGVALPAKPVMITFDDGRANQRQYAVPILKKYAMTATFFVTRKWVVGGNKAFMTADQIRGLADGGFDIGSHSLTHMPLQNKAGESREAYVKRVTNEVAGSKAYVESISGKPCVAIAYPAGYYGNKTWLPEVARQAGYQLGYTVDGGVNRFGQRPFLLKRNDTGRGSFEQFKSFLGK